MTREEFIKRVTENVQGYIDNFDRFDSNPQLRVDPESLYVDVVNGIDMAAEIEDSDEAVENAAAAEGAATKEADDAQVRRNPDLYAVKSILRPQGDTDIPDSKRISEIADTYFAAK